jgi:hypothetical protein
MLTRHVETTSILKHIQPAVRTWTWLRVATKIFLCLHVIRIAVCTLTIVLFAGQAFVPGDLVRKTRVEGTRFTNDVWISGSPCIIILLVELAAFTAVA